MQILIDIPDEQIKKSLEESKHIHEDEGEKGSVHIAMLYTNAQLEFVDVERKTDFYSCEYKILPKEHGRLIDADYLKDVSLLHNFYGNNKNIVPYAARRGYRLRQREVDEAIINAPTIIEADKSEVDTNDNNN
jgi:ribosomal protein S18